MTQEQRQAGTVARRDRLEADAQAIFHCF
jgi:hypothetical protein